MAEGWEIWEREAAELFGLDQTLASGSKFRDPGDAVQRGRHFPFPVLADAKYTEFASISFKLKFLRDWQDKAAELGKRFIMPIRFHIKAENRTDDWVLLSAHDLAELLDLINEQAEPQIEYEVTRLDDDEREPAHRGAYYVTARCGEYSHFAIAKDEAVARTKARQRLEYVMNGFR